MKCNIGVICDSSGGLFHSYRPIYCFYYFKVQLNLERADYNKIDHAVIA